MKEKHYKRKYVLVERDIDLCTHEITSEIEFSSKHYNDLMELAKDLTELDQDNKKREWNSIYEYTIKVVYELE